LLQVATSFRGLLAVLALSFHAVFEGLAVGLEASVANVWYLFAAIATHKLVIAFCVGVELMNSGTRKALLVLYVATFAVVSPLGIGIGVAVAANPTSALTPVTVVLQGMAAGTLVYVVFFEVLQRERANTQSGFFQLVAIMLGFAVMLGLQLISELFCRVSSRIVRFDEFLDILVQGWPKLSNLFVRRISDTYLQVIINYQVFIPASTLKYQPLIPNMCGLAS